MEFLFFLVSLFALFVALRPFTTLLHELGHAIPALLFTSGPVSLVIGRPKTLLKGPLFSLGRLKIWISADPRTWLGGHCKHEQPRSNWQNVVIIAGGVLFSIVIAVGLTLVAFHANAHGFIRSILLIVVISTVMDIFFNWIPDESAVRLPDGRTTMNDGALLRKHFKHAHWRKDLNAAWECMNNGAYDQAWPYLERLLQQEWQGHQVYEYATASLYHMNRYAEAIPHFETWRSKTTLSAHALSIGALLYARTDKVEPALALFREAHALSPDEADPLNNIGYCLNRLGRFEEAIIHFDRALALKPDQAYPLNNRGLARLKLGDRAGGLADIERGLQLDPNNSYGHRNLGIHHLDEGRPQEALELFRKALAMDASTDRIDELITQAEQAIAR